MTRFNKNLSASAGFLSASLSRAILPVFALLLTLFSLQPASAQAYVGRSQRDCLVFIADLTSANQSNSEKAFYKWVEFGAEATAQSILGPQYRRVHVVKGASATRSMLSSYLRYICANSSVQAVDLVFVTHGLSSRVVFSDQRCDMSEVRADIVARIPAINRLKLRAVFSTACYGESHRTEWRNAGFEVVSGSRRIYADSAASFPVFLTAWAGYSSFGGAVGLANAADPARIQDTAAKGLLYAWGNSLWWDVDSYRRTSGNTNLRIYHRPY